MRALPIVLSLPHTRVSPHNETEARERENAEGEHESMGDASAMVTSAADSTAAVLNCIDLSDPDVHKSVSLLNQACTDSGFFYVINHGISQEFMEEVFFQSKRFFALPIDEKMKLLRTEKYRGYTPILDEILDPDKQINELLCNKSEKRYDQLLQSARVQLLENKGSLFCDGNPVARVRN